MNVSHFGRTKLYPFIREISVETTVAPLDAPDLVDAVVIPQTHHQRPDDHVNARTQPSTCDNGRHHFLRGVVDIGPSATSQKLQRRFQLECICVELLLKHESALFHKARLLLFKYG